MHLTHFVKFSYEFSHVVSGQRWCASCNFTYKKTWENFYEYLCRKLAYTYIPHMLYAITKKFLYIKYIFVSSADSTVYSVRIWFHNYKNKIFTILVSMTSDNNASKILSNPFQMLSFCLIEKSNCLIVATNAKVGLCFLHMFVVWN